MCVSLEVIDVSEGGNEFVRKAIRTEFALNDFMTY